MRTAAVDTEFANIATTLAATLANLAILQRDDTKLKDGIVEVHTLSAAVLALIGSDGFTVRGSWVTATAYALGDIVVNGTGTYVCATAHTSGVFVTDLAAVKWVTLFDTTTLAASGVSFTPTGTIAATNAQTAIAEAASEAVQKASNLSDVANVTTARGNLLAAKTVITTKGDLYVGGAAGAEARKAVGADGELLVPSSTATDGLAFIAPGYAILNGTITASVAAKVLTIALKNRAGGDPAADTPVYVLFRNATVTDGTFTIRKVAAALSMTVSSGSTLGFTAAETARIRVGLIDNVGTIELCAWNPKVGTAPALSVFSPSEDVLVTTTAEGGAGTADTAGVIYSTTARASVPFRHAGFIDIQTGATAGEWDNAPAKIQTHGPGCQLPGDTVQQAYSQTGAVATGTTVVPFDDTIPQSGEGDQYMSQAIVPTDAQNLLMLRARAFCASSVAQNFIAVALFQDAVANALASGGHHGIGVTADLSGLDVEHQMVAGTAASTTFKVRAGGDQAGTITFNGTAAARKHGGVLSSFLRVLEIQL